jgi:hypothetical protein
MRLVSVAVSVLFCLVYAIWSIGEKERKQRLKAVMAKAMGCDPKRIPDEPNRMSFELLRDGLPRLRRRMAFLEAQIEADRSQEDEMAERREELFVLKSAIKKYELEEDDEGTEVLFKPWKISNS